MVTQNTNGIGDRIRSARKKKGMTQLCLAVRCDLIHQSKISKIESGECVPSPELVSRIARELGVSYLWLMGGEQK
jgi:transcriptional regulator with XRE-family HTH domain